ncbi:MAG TPA: TlyA family RNA methyltransferase [Acidimicrobiia bacterium]|nr:TlyA family RNA methyltransferase [Acidimicrobiia bacterium]
MAKSRAEAAALVEAGSIRVGGVPTPKITTLVDPGTPVELIGPKPRYVSRGGLKLEAALAQFGVDPSGRRCIDLGASTGGFTDCLLQHGAASVVAVDVGYGQLDDRLTQRPEVTVVDRTNIRHADPVSLGAPFELVVGDLSFISLCTVAGVLARLVGEAGDGVLLVKPQFEVGRAQVGRGGIVRDEVARSGALDDVVTCLGSSGLGTVATCVSPITGAKGNVEFFVHVQPDQPMKDTP